MSTFEKSSFYSTLVSLQQETAAEEFLSFASGIENDVLLLSQLILNRKTVVSQICTLLESTESGEVITYLLRTLTALARELLSELVADYQGLCYSISQSLRLVSADLVGETLETLVISVSSGLSGAALVEPLARPELLGCPDSLTRVRLARVVATALRCSLAAHREAADCLVPLLHLLRDPSFDLIHGVTVAVARCVRLPRAASGCFTNHLPDVVAAFLDGIADLQQARTADQSAHSEFSGDGLVLSPETVASTHLGYLLATYSTTLEAAVPVVAAFAGPLLRDAGIAQASIKNGALQVKKFKHSAGGTRASIHSADRCSAELCAPALVIALHNLIGKVSDVCWPPLWALARSYLTTASAASPDLSGRCQLSLCVTLLQCAHAAPGDVPAALAESLFRLLLTNIPPSLYVGIAERLAGDFPDQVRGLVQHLQSSVEPSNRSGVLAAAQSLALIRSVTDIATVVPLITAAGAELLSATETDAATRAASSFTLLCNASAQQNGVLDAAAISQLMDMVLALAQRTGNTAPPPLADAFALATLGLAHCLSAFSSSLSVEQRTSQAKRVFGAAVTALEVITDQAQAMEENALGSLYVRAEALLALVELATALRLPDVCFSGESMAVFTLEDGRTVDVYELVARSLCYCSNTVLSQACLGLVALVPPLDFVPAPANSSNEEARSRQGPCDAAAELLSVLNMARTIDNDRHIVSRLERVGIRGAAGWYPGPILRVVEAAGMAFIQQPFQPYAKGAAIMITRLAEAGNAAVMWRDFIQPALCFALYRARPATQACHDPCANTSPWQPSVDGSAADVQRAVAHLSLPFPLKTEDDVFSELAGMDGERINCGDSERLQRVQKARRDLKLKRNASHSLRTVEAEKDVVHTDDAIADPQISTRTVLMLIARGYVSEMGLERRGVASLAILSHSHFSRATSCTASPIAFVTAMTGVISRTEALIDVIAEDEWLLTALGAQLDMYKAYAAGNLSEYGQSLRASLELVQRASKLFSSRAPHIWAPLNSSALRSDALVQLLRMACACKGWTQTAFFELAREAVRSGDAAVQQAGLNLLLSYSQADTEMGRLINAYRASLLRLGTPATSRSQLTAILFQDPDSAAARLAEANAAEEDKDEDVNQTVYVFGQVGQQLLPLILDILTGSVRQNRRMLRPALAWAASAPDTAPFGMLVRLLTRVFQELYDLLCKRWPQLPEMGVEQADTATDEDIESIRALIRKIDLSPAEAGLHVIHEAALVSSRCFLASAPLLTTAAVAILCASQISQEGETDASLRSRSRLRILAADTVVLILGHFKAGDVGAPALSLLARALVRFAGPGFQLIRQHLEEGEIPHMVRVIATAMHSPVLIEALLSRGCDLVGMFCTALAVARIPPKILPQIMTALAGALRHCQFEEVSAAEPDIAPQVDDGVVVRELGDLDDASSSGSIGDLLQGTLQFEQRAESPDEVAAARLVLEPRANELLVALVPRIRGAVTRVQRGNVAHEMQDLLRCFRVLGHFAAPGEMVQDNVDAVTRALVAALRCSDQRMFPVTKTAFVELAELIIPHASLPAALDAVSAVASAVHWATAHHTGYMSALVGLVMRITHSELLSFATFFQTISPGFSGAEVAPDAFATMSGAINDVQAMLQSLTPVVQEDVQCAVFDVCLRLTDVGAMDVKNLAMKAVEHCVRGPPIPPDKIVATIIRGLSDLSDHPHYSRLLGILAEDRRRHPMLHALAGIEVSRSGLDLPIHFFDGIVALDYQTRTKAWELATEALKGLESSAAVRSDASVIICTLGVNMLFDQTVTQRVLQEAIGSALAASARLLSLHQYNSVVRQFMRVISSSTGASSRFSSAVHGLVKFLEAYPWSCRDDEAVIGDSAELEVVSAASESDVDQESQSESSENEAEDQTVEQPTTQESIEYLEQRIFPQLLAIISRAVQKSDSKSTGPGDTEKQKQERPTKSFFTAVSSVAVAAVHCLLRLPQRRTDKFVPALIMPLIGGIKGKLNDQREAFRSSLQTVAATLGPRYLSYIIRQIVSSCRRGFVVGVGSYTSAAVAFAVASKADGLFLEGGDVVAPVLGSSVAPGVLDGALTPLLSVANDIAFGRGAEFRRMRHEARAGLTREQATDLSPDIYRCLAAHVSFDTGIVPIVASLRSVLQSTYSEIIVSQVKNLFHQVASGLRYNPTVSAPTLIHFVTDLLDATVGEQAAEAQRRATEERRAEQERLKNPTEQERNFALIRLSRGLEQDALTVATEDGDTTYRNAPVIASFALEVLLGELRQGIDLGSDAVLRELSPLPLVLAGLIAHADSDLATFALQTTVALVKLAAGSAGRVSQHAADVLGLRRAVVPLFEAALAVLAIAGSIASPHGAAAGRCVSLMLRVFGDKHGLITAMDLVAGEIAEPYREEAESDVPRIRFTADQADVLTRLAQVELSVLATPDRVVSALQLTRTLLMLRIVTAGTYDLANTALNLSVQTGDDRIASHAQRCAVLFLRYFPLSPQRRQQIILSLLSSAAQFKHAQGRLTALTTLSEVFTTTPATSLQAIAPQLPQFLISVAANAPSLPVLEALARFATTAVLVFTVGAAQSARQTILTPVVEALGSANSAVTCGACRVLQGLLDSGDDTVMDQLRPLLPGAAEALAELGHGAFEARDRDEIVFALNEADAEESARAPWQVCLAYLQFATSLVKFITPDQQRAVLAPMCTVVAFQHASAPVRMATARLLAAAQVPPSSYSSDCLSICNGVNAVFQRIPRETNETSAADIVRAYRVIVTDIIDAPEHYETDLHEPQEVSEYVASSAGTFLSLALFGEENKERLQTVLSQETTSKVLDGSFDGAVPALAQLWGPARGISDFVFPVPLLWLGRTLEHVTRERQEEVVARTALFITAGIAQVLLRSRPAFCAILPTLLHVSVSLDTATATAPQKTLARDVRTMLHQVAGGLLGERLPEAAERLMTLREQDYLQRMATRRARAQVTQRREIAARNLARARAGQTYKARKN